MGYSAKVVLRWPARRDGTCQVRLIEAGGHDDVGAFHGGMLYFAIKDAQTHCLISKGKILKMY